MKKICQVCKQEYSERASRINLEGKKYWAYRHHVGGTSYSWCYGSPKKYEVTHG